MKYVQFGSGLVAPLNWLNFDSSPTLRIQKSIFGSIIKSKLNVVFPENVHYGDIVKGLPIEDSSVDGMYSSHVLEHLSLYEFRIALGNCYRLLKPGGRFRNVVPDLEKEVRVYIENLESKSNYASHVFMKNTLLGVEKRTYGIRSMISNSYGGGKHLWMWDFFSLKYELEMAGFTNVRKCFCKDSGDLYFDCIEDEIMFNCGFGIECFK
jgi:predicted SAM-dependent methyltransferase